MPPSSPLPQHAAAGGPRGIVGIKPLTYGLIPELKFKTALFAPARIEMFIRPGARVGEPKKSLYEHGVN